MIVGSSVHNQRVERHNRAANEQELSVFREEFYQLESEGLLDLLALRLSSKDKQEYQRIHRSKLLLRCFILTYPSPRSMGDFLRTSHGKESVLII